MARSASKLIGKCAVALHALCKLNTKQRLALLRTADTPLIRCICECALNTLRGTVALKHCQKSRLVKHKKILRRLASNRGSWKSKKRLIVQRGNGFLPLLLAPLLGSLISSLFSK